MTTKKKVLIGAGALLGLMIVGGAMGSGAEEPVEAAAPATTEAAAVTTEAPTTTEAEATTTEAPATTTEAPATPRTVAPAPVAWTMPDFVGQNLQGAQDEIQALTDFGIAFTTSHDATGQERSQVLDSGWTVCDQNVAPGTDITAATEIDFGVVKDFEVCPGDASGTTTTVAPAAMSWTMPDVVGHNLQGAQDEIQALTDFEIAFTTSHDATGQGRSQFLDSGWIVCDQNVAPGTDITAATEIDFGAVKDFEVCP